MLNKRSRKPKGQQSRNGLSQAFFDIFVNVTLID